MWLTVNGIRLVKDQQLTEVTLLLELVLQNNNNQGKVLFLLTVPNYAYTIVIYAPPQLSTSGERAPLSWLWMAGGDLEIIASRVKAPLL